MPSPRALHTQSRAHTLHTGTAVSPSCVCLRRVQGLSTVRQALRLVNRESAAQSGRVGEGADCVYGRPAEAFLTQPNPTQSP